MTKYVYCFNHDRVGKGVGQKRPVPVCQKIKCQHLTEDEECSFTSSEEKQIRKAAKIKMEKADEPEVRDSRTGASRGEEETES